MLSKRTATDTAYSLSPIIVLFIMSIFIASSDAKAQQMHVDDAAITTYRSFQIETWYGSRESWFLTAISPLPYLELGTGLGFDSREGFEAVHWILEGKVVPGELEEEGQAYGLVSGLLFGFDNRIEEVFAYIPYSRMIMDDASVVHVNIGFEAVREAEWEYELSTGIRGDFGITDRFGILSEIAAVNFSETFYQTGIRITWIPDLLEMDITYGEGFRRMETAPGLNIGITFTPGQLW